FFQINVFVGIFNMLPLLPLDGGHAVVAIYERLRSRPGRPYHADFAKLLPLTYAVVMVLVIIGATTIYLDIVYPIVLPMDLGQSSYPRRKYRHITVPDVPLCTIYPITVLYIPTT